MKKIFYILLFSSHSLIVAQAWGGPREIARKIHERITSVPPSEAVLNQMTNFVEAGAYEEAAKVAMENENFYSVTLYNFFTTFTNRDQTTEAPLNDMSATMIGFVRDNIPFNRILSDDIVYHFAETANGQRIWAENLNPNVQPPAGQIRGPVSSSNIHYEDAERRLLPLGDPNYLISSPQSILTNMTRTGTFSGDPNITSVPYSPRAAARLTPELTAGVQTTRAFAAAYYSAGTNRRAWRFTAINFLCKDMSDLQDSSVPDIFIRRDVTRSPGGDGEVYRNKCAGCHAGMDALAKNSNFYNFQNDEIHAGTSINNGTARVLEPAQKTNGNSQNFPAGYINTDQNWVNLWTTGNNARLGWRTPASGQSINQGTGAKSLGEVVAATEAFSKCMVERTFKKVCARSAFTSEEPRLESFRTQFETAYNMKDLFAKVAGLCLVNQ
jgi:hypothetical protein